MGGIFLVPNIRVAYLEDSSYALQTLQNLVNLSLPTVGQTDPVLHGHAAQVSVDVGAGEHEPGEVLLLESVAAGTCLTFLLSRSHCLDFLETLYWDGPRRCQPGLEDAYVGFVERDCAPRSTATAIATVTATTTAC